MVTGLQRFADYFRGLEDQYVLIGGAACDVWLTAHGLPFRATRDLDLVLIVEALTTGFIDRFWEFIATGNYASLENSTDRPQFYRFKGPRRSGYPVMIELLTRNFLELPPEVHLTPIPADEDISSLSAILLDEIYYRFVVESRVWHEGIPTIPAKCLIPLKARAYLDLRERKAGGIPDVKESDVKKHRNDVFRLLQTLAPADRFTVPDLLRRDLIRFISLFPPEETDWSAIQNAVGSGLPSPSETIDLLKRTFALEDKT